MTSIVLERHEKSAQILRRLVRLCVRPSSNRLRRASLMAHQHGKQVARFVRIGKKVEILESGFRG